MNCNRHFRAFLPLSLTDRAINVCTVCSNAPFPIFRVETCSFSQVLDHFAVCRVDLLKTVPNAINIVCCDTLLSSASYSIVVLDHTHYIKHRCLCIQHTLNLLVRCIPVECLDTEQLVGIVECVGCSAHIPFIICSGCEIPSPVGLRVISIGEHIVVLCTPNDLIFCDGIDVH